MRRNGNSEEYYKRNISYGDEYRVTTCTKLEEKNLERGKERLKEENLYLACIESKVVLNPNVRLEECVVNNGNRLILF